MDKEHEAPLSTPEDPESESAGSSTASSEPPADGPLPRAESDRPGRLRRTLGWFWGHAASNERGALASSTEQAMFADRARAALKVAVLGEQGRRVTANGPADAAACEISRQSIYWSLRALDAKNPRSTPDSPSASLKALLASVDTELLARAAGGPNELFSLLPALQNVDFPGYAELPEPEQSRLAQRFTAFAGALLEEANPTAHLADATRLLRMLRIGFGLLLLGAIFIGWLKLVDHIKDQKDLAIGKPWSVSSTAAPGCVSPEQQCQNSLDFFFHTAEQDNPWVVIDLGRLQRISSVEVENRRDCCKERAVPLVLEVSSDGKQFQPILQQAESFSTWTAEFAPLDARWVRLRAQRRTYLHLARVRVFP